MIQLLNSVDVTSIMYGLVGVDIPACCSRIAAQEKHCDTQQICALHSYLLIILLNFNLYEIPERYA